MRKFSILITLICSNVFIANSHKVKVSVTKIKPEPVARWTGTLSRVEKIIHSNQVQSGTVERRVEVSFNAAMPTMNRDDGRTYLDYTDDKGSGIHTEHGDMTNLLTKQKCVWDCTGSGKAELHHVIVREWDNTYDIEAISPVCHGTDCEGKPFENEIMITVSNETFTNRDILSGSKTVTAELIAGLGTATSTTIWHLRRVKEDDVELIVTPQNYDTWLPEPGKDELTKGSMMTVNLKLQGINGKPLKAKAESFELTLNNTSTEPGITINYPIEPDPNQLPDLRFLHLPMIESTDPDQFISVSSPDGINGKTYIGSYDGGGWTILKAEAILTDGRRVQGKLLKPGGEIDIRIPKRDPNSHIGEAWLKKYGNPGEMDDKETSKDNNYKGDGLTAYEEYRGVISESKFKRLDPNKKEVGVVARQKDFSLFNTGVGWFESASDVKVIRFDYDKDEILWNGRLNLNARTSHDFDQYAVYIADGGLGRRGIRGITYGRTNLYIPANVTGVIIDWSYIQILYQESINEAKPDALKFSLNESLAKTVAHELGHAVNINHHGTDEYYNPYNVPDTSSMVRIFDRYGKLIIKRPYTIYNAGYDKGTAESGDMLCVLTYHPYYSWGYTVGADGAHIFNEVPLLPLGKKFCTSKKGTGINATQLYFGDAAEGNCKGQIQLR